MMHDTREVFQAALALSPVDRASLAEKLLQSLEEAERTDIDAAWAQEAEQRLQAYDRGEVKAIPGDEVMKSVLPGRQP